MRPTEPFRREHQELLSQIEHVGQAARELARLDRAERELLVGRIVEFLRGTLVPHAKAEEEVLYPEWARLVGFADAAVPMVHDHEAIVERIERLEQADVDDVDTLQELLYGLYALISVHFRKEEDIQLAAFDAARRRSQRTSSSAWRHLLGTRTNTPISRASARRPTSLAGYASKRPSETVARAGA